MRNADELIAAARATGTYDSYVGDGASIPWESLIFPANYLLYTYKIYLDSNWPQAFQLHDWCYTILGALIAVTREEADNALYEIIARDSIPDARIVWAAVRLGGGRYFGMSMTGVSLTNIPLVPFNRSSNVGIKCVMKMQAATAGPGGAAGRVAGFSESVWFDSDDVASCLTALNEGGPGSRGLLRTRAILLPSGGVLKEVLLYSGGAGRGQSNAVNLPGQSGPTDLPNMALLLSTRSSTGKTRRWFLHCIPDAFVVTGEYQPTIAFRDAMQEYFQSLAYFSFRTTLSTPASATIVNIVSVPAVPPATLPTALVTVQAIGALTQGMDVNLSGLVPPVGPNVSVSGQWIASVPGANQLILNNWTQGNFQDGKIQQIASQSNAFGGINQGYSQIVRAATRKVGRPFGGFVGRASRRR